MVLALQRFLNMNITNWNQKVNLLLRRIVIEHEIYFVIIFLMKESLTHQIKCYKYLSVTIQLQCHWNIVCIDEYSISLVFSLRQLSWSYIKFVPVVYWNISNRVKTFVNHSMWYDKSSLFYKYLMTGWYFWKN